MMINLPPVPVQKSWLVVLAQARALGGKLSLAPLMWRIRYGYLGQY